MNILVWDRQDREIELRLSQAMSSCSKQMHREARTVAYDAEIEEKERARRHVSTMFYIHPFLKMIRYLNISA